MNVGLMVFSGYCLGQFTGCGFVSPVRPCNLPGSPKRSCNLVSAPDDDVMVPVVDGSAVLPDGTTLRFDDGIEAVTHGFALLGKPSDYIEDELLWSLLPFCDPGVRKPLGALRRYQHTPGRRFSVPV